MSSSENITAPSGTDIMDEHRECMEALTRLEEALDLEGETAGGWVRNLRHRIIMLRRHLQGHFCREEQSRLLADPLTQNRRQCAAGAEPGECLTPPWGPDKKVFNGIRRCLWGRFQVKWVTRARAQGGSVRNAGG